MQSNRLVIGMADASLDERLRIADHASPFPGLGTRPVPEQTRVLFHGYALRQFVANVDRLAAPAEEKLRPVRLAAVTAAQGLVAETVQKQPSAEARRRIETILHESSDVANQPARLQALRAIEVL